MHTHAQVDQYGHHVVRRRRRRRRRRHRPRRTWAPASHMPLTKMTMRKEMHGFR